MKHVINIFGASGAGTTTLARKICDELGFFLMDTDDYFWLPVDPRYSQKRPREERLLMMRNDIEHADHVVISGSLVDWGDALIPLFTLAVRLQTDTEIRIDRIKLREKEKFGKRIDVGGDMYQQHLDFIEWAKAYDTGGPDMRSKIKHDEWKKLLPCKILQLNGADNLEDNFLRVKGCL